MPPASTRWAASSATRWQEWNGRFRDDVRRFVKGDNSSVRGAGARGCSAARIIYGQEAREPEQSINFVTCHDGFTLNDLVSYNQKHNEANGEDNRDGVERQHELELRRRRPDRRSGGRGAAQSAGQELLRAAAAGGRHANAAHGRRGASHAARQQQRLLPGQRFELVRLEPARAARGHAAVRQGAQRAFRQRRDIVDARRGVR